MALLLIAMTAAPARAATYPAGGGTFSGGLEGWKVTSNSCSLIGLPLLCTAKSGYDASQGNPAGSLATKTSYLLNLLALFRSEASFESPDFTAAETGAGVVTVQRAFLNGDLVKLNPALSYTVWLVDKTAGGTTEVLAESVPAESAFTTKQAAAPLIAGHTYSILIGAITSSSVAELGVTGSATVLFDNVSITTSKTGDGGDGGGSPGGGGAGTGGSGAGGGNGNSAGATDKLSDARLRTLLRSSMTGRAKLHGKRLVIRSKCPAKAHRACRVRIRGFLNKRRPATAPRTVRIARGKVKRVVLRVKPRFRHKVAKRRSLLFRETVRAGKAKATLYKRVKLVHPRR